MCRRAFSLVETLLAIAVVAILAGILIPVIGNVRSSAQKNLCASNQRELYSAMVLFSQDNDGIVVPNLGQKVYPPIWTDALANYVGLKSWTYFTPGERPTGVFADPSSDNLCDGGAKSDYGKNELVSRDAKNIRTIGSIVNPSRVIFLADSEDGNRECNRDLAAWKNGSSFGMAARHDGQVNMVFFDGHVESKPLSEINFNKNEAPWNPDI